MNLNSVLKAMLITAAAGVLMSATAIAAPQKGAGRQQMLTKCDTDADGKVSQAEAQTCGANAKATAQGKVNSKCDTNIDGTLDDAEKAACKTNAQATATAQRTAADTDGDGKISPAERQAAAAAAKAAHPQQ